MFSQEQRCIYRANQLGEVICQLRFPEILSIGTTVPAAFQDAIRDEFPRYSSRKESLPPKIVGAPGNMTLENQPASMNYQFMSADGIWRVNLTSNFISLACTKYTCWEDFAQKLDKPLAAFIKLYKPAYFERVGLRYLNFISRKDLGLEGSPFRELIQSCYLGPLAEEDVMDTAVNRSSVDAEMAIRGGCRLKLHAGPGLVKKNGQPDPEVKFIFDQDLFMPGNVAVNLSAGALSTLHSQAYAIFRGAITDLLHDAMEPETI
ncbi:MAG: TIGR04255 family protein [Ruminococcaceae bacterium]|nr:TIGR04255 family protein [Oscillospiraceae bacterium]